MRAGMTTRAAITALVAATVGLAQTAVAFAADKPAGLPQLKTEHFAPQLFWLAVTFFLLYLILSRVALPRIGEVIEERRERIERDLATAERLKTETEKAIETYEKALADARANASAIARETRETLAKSVEAERKDVESQLAKKLADAEVRIAVTKSKALESVAEIAGDTAAEIVASLTGQHVSKDEAIRAIAKK